MIPHPPSCADPLHGRLQRDRHHRQAEARAGHRCSARKAGADDRRSCRSRCCCGRRRGCGCRGRRRRREGGRQGRREAGRQGRRQGTPAARRTRRDPVFLLVGLGNPGQKYARTRHNVGFDVVDRLGERWGIAVTRSASQSLVGDGLVKNERAVLMKPQTYVNLSGGPVRAAMDFYKVPIENIVVVHDELEVPFGRVRVKRSGGHGGHNGIRDLNQHLGTDTRVCASARADRPRVGIRPTSCSRAGARKRDKRSCG